MALTTTSLAATVRTLCHEWFKVISFHAGVQHVHCMMFIFSFVISYLVSAFSHGGRPSGSVPGELRYEPEDSSAGTKACNETFTYGEARFTPHALDSTTVCR
jgi:hypothetical protein